MKAIAVRPGTPHSVHLRDVPKPRLTDFDGMSDADRRAPRTVGVAGDALVRNVEMLAVTVEQFPQRRRTGVGLRVRIARVFGEFRHPQFRLRSARRASGSTRSPNFLFWHVQLHIRLAVVNIECYSIY